MSQDTALKMNPRYTPSLTHKISNAYVISCILAYVLTAISATSEYFQKVSNIFLPKTCSEINKIYNKYFIMVTVCILLQLKSSKDDNLSQKPRLYEKQTIAAKQLVGIKDAKVYMRQAKVDRKVSDMHHHRQALLYDVSIEKKRHYIL